MVYLTCKRILLHLKCYFPGFPQEKTEFLTFFKLYPPQASFVVLCCLINLNAQRETSLSSYPAHRPHGGQEKLGDR